MGHALRKDDAEYRLPVTLEQVVTEISKLNIPEPLRRECWAEACRKWVAENQGRERYVIHDYAYSSPSMRA